MRSIAVTGGDTTMKPHPTSLRSVTLPEGGEG
jgi:hypothetical protein